MSIETPAVGLYATCEARLRALYQIPTPPGKAAVLELRLGDEGRVIDDAWPADLVVSCRLTETISHPCTPNSAGARVQTCEAAYDAPLPFAADTFDLVILHHTLDELASVFSQRSSQQVAEDCLRRVAHVLRPGGLVVGCGLNRSSPRAWYERPRAARRVRALGVHSCRNVLLRSGFADAQVFNLLPGLDNPRGLSSVDAQASRITFRRALEASRASLGTAGYLARRIVVGLSLNRFIENVLFYWGYKPC
ncbi:class I SAM-dependent methyltransferase [Accumulibacter sp.]|uniref:methyltransferase domain-containing protein n=5 Tax=Accumulibacter sp. TaxID=2053492 RepID=UPI00261B91CE|nr:class I SAM-dependent methyltransferase [Accumulibacter sp.]MDS4054149.1 class I SAM-dependent methyltransferase [Accumulibacter sp.]HMW64930.1 class I SAM-dependent methyltransferase [Accumulibacter sp.]HMX67750.1 class I SAM-dependent methyltransferase [Accumulibacter sp.]HND38714.1 class I SAM-dependent methyltransferase [Accumulibacter sp.]HNE39491.1 class I SAM-dependent methyltransferase [Accumulibacter sp.]